MVEKSGGGSSAGKLRSRKSRFLNSAVVQGVPQISDSKLDSNVWNYPTEIFEIYVGV